MAPKSKSKHVQLDAREINSVKSKHEENINPGKLLKDKSFSKTIKPDERAKLRLEETTESIAARPIDLTSFFDDLPASLGKAFRNSELKMQHFGFDNHNIMAEFIKAKALSLSKAKFLHIRDKNSKEYIDAVNGYKRRFLGRSFWERYIIFGPIGKEIEGYARFILNITNQKFQNGRRIMKDVWGNEKMVSGKFEERLYTGVEFQLKVERKDKKQNLEGNENISDADNGNINTQDYLDFGHITFNQNGDWMIPAPVEIKLPDAAKFVAEQFSSFIPRLQGTQSLIIKFPISDYPDLLKQKGKAILEIWEDKEAGVAVAVMDHKRLVFDPLLTTQTVAVPDRKTWKMSNDSEKSKVNYDNPDLEEDIAVSKNTGLIFIKMKVYVNQTPFVKLFNELFDDLF